LWPSSSPWPVGFTISLEYYIKVKMTITKKHTDMHTKKKGGETILLHERPILKNTPWAMTYIELFLIGADKFKFENHWLFNFHVQEKKVAT
jgi:hypothetical protein